jgi:hypothetical protein
MFIKRVPGWFGILVFGLPIAWSSASAQNYWADDNGRAILRAEFLKPFLKGDVLQFASGAAFLSGSARLGPTSRIEAELPVASASIGAGGFGTGSSLRIGDPYLGVRIHREGQLLSGQFGVRIPLVGEPADAAGAQALGVGALADPDRFEAFAPNVLTARAAAEVRHVEKGGFLVGAKLGGSLFVNTKGGEGDNAEVFADYGARVGYQNPNLLAAVAVTGRLWVTQSGLSFSDRTEHVITGSLQLERGRVRPGILVRVPLDQSVRESLHATVGVGLTVVL